MNRDQKITFLCFYGSRFVKRMFLKIFVAFFMSFTLLSNGYAVKEIKISSVGDLKKHGILNDKTFTVLSDELLIKFFRNIVTHHFGVVSEPPSNRVTVTTNGSVLTLMGDAFGRVSNRMARIITLFFQQYLQILENEINARSEEQDPEESEEFQVVLSRLKLAIANINTADELSRGARAINEIQTLRLLQFHVTHPDGTIVNHRYLDPDIVERAIDTLMPRPRRQGRTTNQVPTIDELETIPTEGVVQISQVQPQAGVSLQAAVPIEDTVVMLTDALLLQAEALRKCVVQRPADAVALQAAVPIEDEVVTLPDVAPLQAAVLRENVMPRPADAVLPQEVVPEENVEQRQAGVTQLQELMPEVTRVAPNIVAQCNNGDNRGEDVFTPIGTAINRALSGLRRFGDTALNDIGRRASSFSNYLKRVKNNASGRLSHWFGKKNGHETPSPKKPIKYIRKASRAARITTPKGIIRSRARKVISAPFTFTTIHIVSMMLVTGASIVAYSWSKTDRKKTLPEKKDKKNSSPEYLIDIYTELSASGSEKIARLIQDFLLSRWRKHHFPVTAVYDSKTNTGYIKDSLESVDTCESYWFGMIGYTPDTERLNAFSEEGLSPPPFLSLFTQLPG